jgi:hypothetical protein
MKVGQREEDTVWPRSVVFRKYMYCYRDRSTQVVRLLVARGGSGKDLGLSVCLLVDSLAARSPEPGTRRTNVARPLLPSCGGRGRRALRRG